MPALDLAFPGGLSWFDPPAGSDVLIVTHILELPIHLGLANQVQSWFDVRSDVFVGWSDEEKARLVYAPAEKVPFGKSPTDRFVFSSATVRQQLPLEAADRAFGHFRRPLVNKQTWEQFLNDFSVRTARGWYADVSVVAASRFLAMSHWPDSIDEQRAVLVAELAASISLLNRFLVALGATTGRPNLGPIAVGDLPAVVPVVLEVVPPPVSGRVGTSFAYPARVLGIHDFLSQSLDDESLNVANQIAVAHDEGGMPFFAVLDLVQQAIRLIDEGRHTSGVIACGTGVEVLIATVIREVGRLRGETDADIQDKLRSGFRNIVVDHLPNYIGAGVEIGVGTTDPIGVWWHGGYKHRNAAVHEGAVISDMESTAALDEVMFLIRHIKECLLRQENTMPLGEQIIIWERGLGLAR
jgi:hypothetical protein